TGRSGKPLDAGAEGAPSGQRSGLLLCGHQGDWDGGEAFGGELRAWRRHRIGVSRAGRIGAVGSGAQRAAVGHRPIIAAGREFFFTAPA
ncbi:hypothetical protein ACSNOK_34580, partial [Streptomyces sp. URMC 126]|uniref:hypothetical protein n=1 Tax=Streptomyces sp. URMC 126 TaxID=3423401 RepID=UPI003F1A96E6